MVSGIICRGRCYKDILSIMLGYSGFKNSDWSGEVVVAQLVERSLLIPEVRGSNPVIGKYLLILNNYCILSTVY